MSHSHHEAPRELIAVLWSIAGTLALFFAISISSLFIFKYYYPVDASTVTTRPVQGKCVEGSAAIAINNYPGPDNINKYVTGNSAYKTGEVLKPLGGKNFRCSQICVPEISTAAGKETENRAKVVDYLNGGSINGKPIVFVANGEAFMQKWVEWNKETNAGRKDFLAQDLQRTVIQSQSKPDCQGPNSEDYGEIVSSKGDAIPVTKPNDTVQQAVEQGKTDAATGTVATTGNDGTGQTAGASLAENPNQVTLPTGLKTDNEDKSTSTISNCRARVNKFLYDYREIDYATINDPIRLPYSTIEGQYKEYKDKEIFTKDPKKAIAKCQEWIKMIDKVTAESPELKECKKDISQFIAEREKYLKKNKLTDNRLTEIKGRLSALKNQLFGKAQNKLDNCNNIKDAILEYKRIVAAEAAGQDPLYYEKIRWAEREAAATEKERQVYVRKRQVESTNFWSSPTRDLARFGTISSHYTWRTYNKSRGYVATLVKYGGTGDSQAFWSLRAVVNGKYKYYAAYSGQDKWIPDSRTSLSGLVPVASLNALPPAFTSEYL